MSEIHHTMALNDMYIFDTPDDNVRMTILASNPNIRAIIKNRIRHEYISQLKRTVIHTKIGIIYDYSGTELSKKINSTDSTKILVFRDRVNKKNFLHVVV